MPFIGLAQPHERGSQVHVRWSARTLRGVTSPKMRLPEAWWFGVRLHALDRWPVYVSDDRVWEYGRFEEPFGCRWNGDPVPERAQHAFDVIASTAQQLMTSAVARRARQKLFERQAQRTLRATVPLDSVNRGFGGRKSNTLQVALAVDAHLDGNPASALAWNGNEDPILVVDVHDVAPTFGPLERAKTRAEAERRVREWGPGAKGIVSVRDPNQTFHRIVNVSNRGGRVAFEDWSRPGHNAVHAADDVFAHLDGTSPFAGIQLWRTQNLSDGSRLPDDVLLRSRDEQEALVAAALSSSVTETARRRTVARIVLLHDFHYAAWLLERTRRGACTFLGTELDQLTIPGRAAAFDGAITNCDEAIVSLASVGRMHQFGDTLEMVVPDTTHIRAVVGGFEEAVIRDTVIEGLTSGWIEVVLNEASLNGWSADVAPSLVRERKSVPERSFSWVDVNRAFGPGQRKTNCWNCSAAVAVWLSDHAPSTALPIYPGSGYRPTIPQYLDAMGASGKPTFVANRADLEATVRTWPAQTHGLVVASLSAASTHMFNVAFDGDEVRYYDGYIGRFGAYNFDVTWEKLAVVPLGHINPLFAPAFPL